jgi:hypothetical protein
MKQLIILVSVVLSIPIFCTGQQFNNIIEAEKVAIVSMNSWLKLVDDNKYGRSWNESAQLFKNSVIRTEWIQLLKNTRRPLGRLINRELISLTYTTSMLNAPEGEYVVIEYNTVFKEQSNVIETVTLVRINEESWRVSGYFFR